MIPGTKLSKSEEKETLTNQRVNEQMNHKCTLNKGEEKIQRQEVGRHMGMNPTK